jgi:8-oxo-dGTP pyrophosphatase MutT (NUDIX family)
MFERFFPAADGRRLAGDATVQFGAMPYSIVEGRVAFLLITSRRTGRWIFPKGALITGLTPGETAAQEAFEEAGVEGVVDGRPIGQYRTVKQRLTRTLIDVQLFPLRVERQLDEWPEMQQRHRHWVMLKEAQRLLSDSRAADLAEQLNARILGAAAPRRQVISAVSVK